MRTVYPTLVSRIVSLAVLRDGLKIASQFRRRIGEYVRAPLRIAVIEYRKCKPESGERREKNAK